MHSHFTSLVHSTALMIDQLRHLQPSVLLELRRLASRFFHLYPNLSSSQQGRCVTAFTSLLTALHAKHTPAFHALIDTAVHEGLLLTISKLPDYYNDVCRHRPAASDDATPSTTDYEQLYVHLFPVIIRLACDTEVVTSQVFSPLLTQLIHWYTNRETTYKREMKALLDALCDAVGNADDSALRQRCAAALAEFFLWSSKHSAAAANDGGGC